MRIISLTVNGLKNAAEQGLFEWLKEEQADVVCLQNTQDREYKLPDSVLYPDGFNGYFFEGETDDYSGVAIYTRELPKAIMTGLGFPACDFQGRYIQADFEHVSVGSVLFPKEDAFHSLEDKLAFQTEFLNHLKKTRRKRRDFIFCGNFEAAHKTIDVANWRQQQDVPGFLPEERAFLDQAFGPVGFVDAFREANFGENQFTWWPNEEARRLNIDGKRIDYQICTPNLRQYVVEAKILRDVDFGDHAPVLVEYEFDED
jgi:exodeoxyribonuclease-3